MTSIPTSAVTTRWRMRLVNFVLCALAGASVAYWGLRWLGYAPFMPAPTTPSVNANPSAPGSAKAQSTGSASINQDFQLVAQIMGVTAPQAAGSPQAASRFSLLGVAFAGSQQGAALIAIDGKPPKHFRVGQELDAGLRLLSLTPRGVNVGQNKVTAFTLELPVKAR